MCEDSDGCRRVPLLRALGQEAAATSCGGGCDNCAARAAAAARNRAAPPPLDLTREANLAVRVVSRMAGALSFNQTEKVLRGSKERRTLADGHDQLAEYGTLQRLSKPTVKKLLQLLIVRRVLREDCMPGAHGGFSSRVFAGKEAWTVVHPPGHGGGGGAPAAAAAAAAARFSRARRSRAAISYSVG